jgi:hypothetical protein
MKTTLLPCSGTRLQQIGQEKAHDHVSELPDVILVDILSRVTMKEAASTSILSCKWKDLWKHRSCLDFDKWSELHNIKGWYFLALEDRRNSFRVNNIFERRLPRQLKESTQSIQLRKRTTDFVNWVDQILDSNKAPTIYEMRIHFDLHVDHKNAIDRWVNLVLGKRVQVLDLDLKRLNEKTRDCYPFPEMILGNPNISLLRALSMNYIDVTNEELSSLLSKIPSVESLCVSSSESLAGHLVLRAPPKLKNLVISSCENLTDLQIDAVNLESLTFVGPRRTGLCLENTPNLVEVSFGGRFCERTPFVFPKPLPVSHFASQLQMLTLDLYQVTCGFFPDIPVLVSLKQLELILRVTDYQGVIDSACLIKACPVLCKLILQFKWKELLEKKREVEKKKCLLPDSLTWVELRKFRGGTTDVEMAVFLFENAKFIQTICIDTRDPWMVDTSVLEQTVLDAKKCAKQLASQFYPNAELVLL